MTKFSVLDLIDSLSTLVNSNLDIDFNDVAVSLDDSEAYCSQIRLQRFYNLDTNKPFYYVDLF